ncbi:MAG: class I tRNA ligase family protein [Candidatus Eremiobacterota bacterium]
MFRPVSPQVRFPEMEECVLAYWREHGVFHKSLERRRDAPEFIFYEGPPTANGKPGVHHVQARAYKDLFPRYKTMRGFLVRRKAGWDCHGLPVEIEVEKRLGFSGKKAIEDYGIEPFNRQCRESVMEYEGHWRQLTERIAFWLDMDDAYLTMTNDYVESVWWSLKELWDKGLVYQGYKVVPFCANDSTPLSSHEVGLGWKDVKDPSITVRFPLVDPPDAIPAGTKLLVWTTTPWTLPGNTACAVHPDMTYVLVCKPKDDDAAAWKALWEQIRAHPGGLEALPGAQSWQDWLGSLSALAGQLGQPLPMVEFLLLAESLKDRVVGTDATVLRSFKGSQLVDLRYQAPYQTFDYQTETQRAAQEGKVGHRVVAGEFVTAEDGTGIVHIAPAFGADDLEMARRFDLPVVHPVGVDGRFVPQMELLAGMWFKDADKAVMRDLKDRGLLFKREEYAHAYPHCWRCSKPLMYYATDSWFIANTLLKERLIERNQELNWIPPHIKTGRYGDWLNNLVDWALSRTRYWGTPLPIWVCAACGTRDAVGSFRELADRSLQPLDVTSPDFDPHRPYVDEIRFRCPKCQGEMERVKDVIDCWYDSGAMPFAQLHYPFENKERFERQAFPADFICEGLDQTRGWFNSLHQLGVMLFDSVAYRTVICHGLVLDHNGEKMSKRLGNIVDPWSVIDEHGADALRWYLYTSAPPEQNRRFSAALVGEACRRFLVTLWNTYHFYVLNANANRVDRSKARPVAGRSALDRWILARLHGLIGDVTERMDLYDVTGAARAIDAFVDELSNWYVRRSRSRFWDGEPDANATLHDVLVTLSQVCAPFVPFLSEDIYRNLTGGESVHLTDWPQVDPALLNPDLVHDTSVTIRAVSAGRSARTASGQRTRQPLALALVGVSSARDRQGLERFLAEFQEELNVKEVRFLEAGEAFLDYNLKPNLPLMGKKYGKQIPAIREALAKADPKQVARQVQDGQFVPLTLADGSTVELLAEEVLVEARSPEGYAAQEEAGVMVALSTELTPALVQEGTARDLIRHVQELRKKADLVITQRIRTWLGLDGPAKEAAEAHRRTIMEETLSVELTLSDPPVEAVQSEVELEPGRKVRAGLIPQA